MSPTRYENCDRLYILPSCLLPPSPAQRRPHLRRETAELLLDTDVALGYGRHPYPCAASLGWFAEGPYAPVGEVEDRHQAEHQERAGDPDQVGRRVLHHLQAGEGLLTQEGERQALQLGGVGGGGG